MNRVYAVALALTTTATTGCGLCELVGLCSDDTPDEEVIVRPPNTLETHQDPLPVDFCDEIPGYRDQFGVTDVNGEPHPGNSGWTSFEYKIACTTCPVSLSSTGGYHCFCNEQTYAELGDCLSSCDVTLACFVGVCQPVGSVRAVATLEKVTVSADIGVSTFTWTPDDQSPACFAARIDWEARIMKHEREHVRQVLDVVNEVDQRWNPEPPLTYEAEGETEAEALDRLNELVFNAFQAEKQWMLDDTQRRGNEFHATPEGAPIASLNCAFCD